MVNMFTSQGRKNAKLQHRVPKLLPIEALKEIFSFSPRSKRARLVLVNSQVAHIIVSAINSERQQVSLLTPHTLASTYAYSYRIPDPLHLLEH